ncbi:RDD family protein [Sporosarcina sp. FA9]|uniref:RDD family protein n=1 Tax=Sporosarcina sp. FA9 TaxID=3413030 RepID=UPI003F65947E
MSEYNEHQLNPAEMPIDLNKSYNQTIETNQYRPKIAGFWIRFWAYSIDVLVVYALSGLFIKPVFRAFDVSVSSPIFLFFNTYKITALLLFLAYFLLMTKFLHQTVGKMILGIKVVPKEGVKLNWGTVVFREVFGRFISKTLLFPYLLPVFMPKKEALHDLLADTYVIHENSFDKVVNLTTDSKARQLHEGAVV